MYFYKRERKNVNVKNVLQSQYVFIISFNKQILALDQRQPKF